MVQESNNLENTAILITPQCKKSNTRTQFLDTTSNKFTVTPSSLKPAYNSGSSHLKSLFSYCTMEDFLPGRNQGL